MFRENLRKQLKDEKEKMRGMSRNEKWSYILAYYKLPIGIALLLLYGTALFIWNQIVHNEKTVYCVAIVNEEMDVERDRVLSGQLNRYLGLDEETQTTVIDSNYNIPYQFDDRTEQALYVDGSVSSDYSTYDKFFLNISTNSIQAAIMPEDFLEYCNGLGTCFTDLRDSLSEEGIEQYEERICYGTDENGIKYPCGIYTDGTIFDASYFAKHSDDSLMQAYGRQVLVFPDYNGIREQNEGFLKFVLEELQATENEVYG